MNIALSTPPLHEVYALKYARHERRAGVNFLGGDPRDEPMPMDYFIWAIRGPAGWWVVDTGFGASGAQSRNRQLLRTPAQALAELEITASNVENVILTHLHYDHAGTCEDFTAATFHVQDREMQYATGRYMGHRCLHEAYSVFDVVRLVQTVYASRVRFHDGDAQLAPGLSVHLIGGHTMGLQVVRVHTARGWVVLASDASHYFRNIEERRPFPIVYSVGEMVEGWRRIEELADSSDHVIPGHDPRVLEMYPSPEPRLDGIVAVLHCHPRRG